MMRLWKTTSLALAVALAVTACGAGANEGGPARGTEGGVSALGAAGARTPMSTARERAGDARKGGPLIDADDPRSPFPTLPVRPLNAGNGAGFGALQTQTVDRHRPVTLSYVRDGGEKYVSLDQLVKLMQFEHYETDAQGAREIGDKDVQFRLTPGSTQAEAEGEPFQLPAAPKMINGSLMIPVSSVLDLFDEELVAEPGKTGLLIYPSDTTVEGDPEGEDADVDPSLDFADDPNDPFKGEDAEGAFAGGEALAPALPSLEAAAADPEAVPALKNININALLRTANRYMGVKYKFGAKPYPRTNRFDCSSFTQYVYGKYGIDLPRTSRAQARVGRTVSRKSLRKGDLLFFYVPGRFKTNKTVGHVGIYLGGGKMIHANSAPKNGVQIGSINKAYWKRTFIRAKRVAY
ncbi:NlpC/P60 family protein [Paenibacillus sp.]|uniref:C40 family peptidase n=1 Tax=Paenibacillus sp. TaxID=58172 RepID=UPI002D663C5E|nr:NlpC/P60 family protein [Paenibacillus sp.]HZG83605.1 NlpC/P60 family protein [Paenibacillus sp.]